MSFSHNRLHVAAVALAGLAALGIGTRGHGGAGTTAPSQQAGASPISSEWVEKWTQDLRVAQRAVEEQHPNAFHTLSRDEWDREFDTLVSRLPALAHHEVIVELARIIARIEDGHTRLTLPLAPGVEFMQGHSQTPPPHLHSLVMHPYPVRFAIDSKGLYVRSVGAAHRLALGGRVTRIGRLGVDEALAAVRPTIRRDNAFQVLHHLPMHLALADLLHARGVTETRYRLRLDVDTPEGLHREIILHRVPSGETVEWIAVGDSHDAPMPLSQQHPGRNFWLEHLRASSTVYVQFNEVYDAEDEKLRDFAMRLGTVLRENDVENLVVDLRRNRGGNQELGYPLLHAIIASRVNRTGHLYALIGRATFSAAMTFTLLLEKHTNALFVGEPTGSSPNHYGDSRKIRLPNTGLTMRVSTLYWQYNPTDHRRFVAPHVPVEQTLDDDLRGRDAALDTVFAIIDARARATSTELTLTSSAIGSWHGFTSPGLNSFDMTLDIEPGDATWRVRVSLPSVDIEAIDDAAHYDAGALSFRLVWRDEPMRFTGEVTGDWLIGRGDFRSVYFPFVLRRQDDAHDVPPLPHIGNRGAR